MRVEFRIAIGSNSLVELEIVTRQWKWNNLIAQLQSPSSSNSTNKIFNIKIDWTTHGHWTHVVDGGDCD